MTNQSIDWLIDWWKKRHFELWMINVSRNTCLAELLQELEGEGEMTSEWTNDT